MTDNQARPETGRRRNVPLLWISGGLAATLLVLGVNGTISSWTEAIMSNGNNHVGSTTAVALEESGPDSAGVTVTCTTTSQSSNQATCNQVNKYGNGGIADLTMSPGDSISTTVTLTNTASGDGTVFTMAPGACSTLYNAGSNSGNPPAPADDLCDSMQVGVVCSGGATLTVAPVSLTAFNAGAPYTLTTGLASGATATCVFTVSLPAATTANYSGQTSTQSIVWTLDA